MRRRAPGRPGTAQADGKVDTGSDLCAVPAHLVAALDLPPVRSARAVGFAGPIQEAVVYRVDLEIDGLTFSRVEALATARPYVLVGRNVLRRLVVRLDGPGEQMDVRRPRA